MKNRLNKVNQYNNAIRVILLKEWDPIGVKEGAEARDEYDFYIHQICKLLINQESPEKIYQYLREIVTDQMGLVGNPNHTKSIAKKLTDLIVKIAEQNP